MPWTDLPTNFKNLVWSGLKKFRQYNNPDQTVSFEDVTDYVDTENTQMSASQLNQMTGAINDIMNGEVFYTEDEVDTLLAGKQDTLTFDSVPTEGSENPVTSDGIKTVLDEKKADIIVTSASGAIATFPDGSPVPVVNLIASIDPVQTGEGDPSPSNVRPITGWTGCSVFRASKNLLDITKFQASGSGTAVTVTDNSIRITNASSVRYTNMRLYHSAEWDLPKVSALTFSFTVTGVNVNESFTIGIRTVSGNSFISGHSLAFTADGTYSFTFRMDNLTEDWYLGMTRTTNATDDVDMTFTNMQIELGSTATAYEPYIGTAYLITFPASAGTVYGGTLDVTTGLLTVTRVVETFDGDTSEDWTKYSTTLNSYYINVSYLPETSTPYLLGNTTNRFPWAVKTSPDVPDTVRFATGNTGLTYPKRLYIILTTVANDLNEFRNWLSQNNLQVCYKLATPITYQLSPTEVTTLLGLNTISADSGAVEVTYRADTKLYIDSKIAESQRATRSLIAGIETAMTASKNYSVGDLLIVGDSLYTVTANISNGSAITVGTNVTATTVAEQLIALANA